MNKFILSAIIATCAFAAVSAQDTIVFKNADEVLAKVTAVTPTEVSYKRWDNLDGPVYTINSSSIFYIKYQNGTKDVFDNVTTNDTHVNVIKPHSANAPSKVKLQSYIYAGAAFLEQAGGPTFDVNLGIRIYKYAYVGIETGFHCIFDSFYDDEEWTCGYIPIAVNLKGYIPTRNKKIYPYINCSLGGFLGVMDFEYLNGFYCQVGAGIDIKRFSIGIGYSGLVKGEALNCGYVKLGIRLGKL
ncbi:MAG: hypothetical protein ACI35T_04775 [Alistipes sp.]